MSTGSFGDSGKRLFAAARSMAFMMRFADADDREKLQFISASLDVPRPELMHNASRQTVSLP